MNQTFLGRYCDRVSQRLLTVPLLLGVLTLTLTNPVVAQEKLLRTLTVTGRGVESIPTTQTEVRLGVEIQGKTATAVQQEVTRRSSAVVELLRSRNVEKLETTGIRLNPIYRSEDNEQRITGYSGTNTVSFRTSTEQAGKLLDDAVTAGATRIDSVNFMASDEAIATAQKQALQEATQDAQQQADAVLSTVNLTRREIITIQVNGASLSPPTPIFTGRDRVESRLDDNFSATTKLSGEAIFPIVSGEQEVQASVTLLISY